MDLGTGLTAPANATQVHGSGNWIQNPADLRDQWAVFLHYGSLVPTGTWLAPGGMVLITENGQRRLLGHSYNTSANYTFSSFAKFSPDGNYVLFTSDMNGSARSDVFLAELPTKAAPVAPPAVSPTAPTTAVPVTPPTASLTAPTGGATVSGAAAGFIAAAVPVKFTVSNAPPLPAPTLISSVAASSITVSRAVITWMTNKPSNSQVEYSPTTSYSSTTPLDPSLVTAHTVTLSGLTAGTLYHYRVTSKDAAATLAVSPDLTFTTASAASPTPPLISSVVVSLITASGAAITWTTDKPSDSQVEYGPTTSYGSTAALDPSLVTAHVVTLSGLAAGTPYHYRVKS
jgi:hypothetical protein